MTMAVQCYIPILSEQAIWCAKGKVECTVLLHWKQHLIFLQKNAGVEQWLHERNKAQHHWQLVYLQKPNSISIFSSFWHHKIDFNPELLDVWWALILLRSLCFRNVPILLWYFTPGNFAKRKKIGIYFKVTTILCFYGVIPTEHSLLWTVEN